MGSPGGVLQTDLCLRNISALQEGRRELDAVAI